jgi:hypothetical protein
MASIKFDITGNANGFVAATRQAEAASKGLFSKVAEDGKKLDDTFKKIATSAGALFTVQMASQFSTKVVISSFAITPGKVMSASLRLERGAGGVWAIYRLSEESCSNPFSGTG